MAGGINPFGFAVSGGGAFVPRAMPAPVGDAPFGFAFTPPVGPSKWDRIKQALWETNLAAPIRGYYNLRNANPYTLYTDTGAAGQQLAADSFDAAGGITVGSMPMPKPANSLSMGIKAYHGSPHSFDKFDMSKIGTGEGAQAYGHGLYFAENEGIAKGYRDKLIADAKKNPNFVSKLDGVPPPLTDAEKIELKDLDRQLANNGGTYLPPDKMKRYKELNFKNYDHIDAVDAIPGYMYEVNIAADPNTFLDWDKPLSEQPEAVQNAFYGGKGIPENAKAMTGMEAYIKAASGLGNPRSSSPEAAQFLKEKGIPGVKYLDAGSRGAGDGTRNFVVFDDKLVSILRKYGLAPFGLVPFMNGQEEAQGQY